MEPIRVRGIVRRAEPGEGPVLLRILVRAGDTKVGRVDRIVAFDVEGDGGERVRVEPSAKVRLEPMSEGRDRWDAIEDDPDLAPLRKRAPGPHVTVTVLRAAVREGDRVVVAGEAIEHAFDEATAGPREAPVRRLTRVRALAIATGDDADALVDRALRGKTKPAKKANGGRRPWRMNARVVVALIGALLAAAAWVIPISPVKVDVAAFAASLLATAAALATAARMPRFVHGGAPVAKLADSHGKVIALAAVAVLSFVIFPTFGDATSYGNTTKQPPVNGSMLSVVFVSAQIAVQLGMVAIGTRRVASLLRVLLRAPLWGKGHLEDTWGATEGTVRDPTPITVDGAKHALANVIEREVRSGSDPDIIVEKVVNRGTFFVESDDGSFEVDPSRATWASTVRVVRSETKSTDVVPIGGTVLVAGRATRPAPGLRAQLAEGGHDALIFLATSAGTSPRARARQVLEIRVLGLVALAACLAALIVTASSLEPQLPAFYIEGD